MPRATFGSQVKEQAKRLLEDILLYVNGELDTYDESKLEFKWQDEYLERPKLSIITTRRFLEYLTAKDVKEDQLTARQVRESLYRLKDIGILTDQRFKTKGYEVLYFTLTLWSKRVFINIERLNQEWENRKPTKSQNSSTESQTEVSLSESSINLNANNIEFVNQIHRVEKITKSFNEDRTLANIIHQYSISKELFLEHISRPVYLHFLDRELLTSFGVYDLLPESLIKEDVRLILFSIYEPAYFSTSLIFENKFARNIFQDLLPLFKTGHIQIALKEHSLYEFIASKQEQYFHVKQQYSFYFDDTWKRVVESGPCYLHKETDTGIFVENEIVSDLENNRAYDSVKRLEIRINKKEIDALNPYIIESLRERKKTAVTRLLFSNTYEEKQASTETRSFFNMKITENYVNAYILEYSGTIATSLSVGIEHFSYLCNTFPFHHLRLWRQVYHSLGCLPLIRRFNPEEIVIIKETPDFQNFIDEVRFFIANAIRNYYLNTINHSSYQRSMLNDLERAIRIHLKISSSQMSRLSDYLDTINKATEKLKYINQRFLQKRN
ncbi:hypothetical protein ACEYW6_35530 [Nostoc sp. UIC 10607]|uniref:hypothetical protein n=1 Tax=Nostoc sp. UIC 10607 TaxID=3045935 RepID=UPI00399F228B